MWILHGLLAGVLAGTGMIIVSEAGYRSGIIKSHLVVVDGSFAVKLLKISPTLMLVYCSGIVIHLCTGAVFGIVYTGLAYYLNFDTFYFYGWLCYLSLFLSPVRDFSVIAWENIRGLSNLSCIASMA